MSQKLNLALLCCCFLSLVDNRISFRMDMCSVVVDDIGGKDPLR